MAGKTFFPHFLARGLTADSLILLISAVEAAFFTHVSSTLKYLQLQYQCSNKYVFVIFITFLHIIKVF